MTLVRFDQRYNHHLHGNRNENSLMGSWMRNFDFETDFEAGPSANIIELEKSFTIEIAVPGYSKEDIQLQVENSVLSVTHEEADERNDLDKRYIRQEYKVGGFTRSFRLSRWVNHEKIAASFKNGILSIEIPKKDEAIAKPAREIKIS